ncbi:MAG: hypothetical protein WD208_09835 [Dehalococcoidia bacterium]
MSQLKKWRWISIAPVVIAAVAISATASASGGASPATFYAVGDVAVVGFSTDPAHPTTSESKFVLGQYGDIKSASITTYNEMVLGALGGPGGSSSVVQCQDRDRGATCDALDDMLTGAPVSSMHTSTADLEVQGEGVIQAPDGAGGVLDIPVVYGGLTGAIHGTFTLGSGEDIMHGESTLRIERGSSGVYACFVSHPALGIVPSPFMEACTHGLGGQMFPVSLDVVDSGRFKMSGGTGEFEAIQSLSGKIQVTVHIPSLVEPTAGSILITGGRAILRLPDDDSPGKGGPPAWVDPPGHNKNPGKGGGPPDGVNPPGHNKNPGRGGGPPAGVNPPGHGRR